MPKIPISRATKFPPVRKSLFGTCRPGLINRLWNSLSYRSKWMVRPVARNRQMHSDYACQRKWVNRPRNESPISGQAHVVVASQTATNGERQASRAMPNVACRSRSIAGHKGRSRPNYGGCGWRGLNWAGQIPHMQITGRKNSAACDRFPVILDEAFFRSGRER